MAIEFRKRGIHYSVQNNIEVLYEGECVGMQRLDFVIDRKVAVELKSTGAISKTHGERRGPVDGRLAHVYQRFG